MTQASERTAAENTRRIGLGDPNRPAVGWTEIGVGAAGYLVLSVLLIFVVALAFPEKIPTLAVVAATGVAPVTAVAIALAIRVRSWAAVGLRRVSWRWILIGVGAGIGVFLVNRLVIISYVALTGDAANPQADLVEVAGTWLGLAGLLTLGAILVPFGEELLFRGTLYGGLRRYGVPIATIASALLFGLAHGINVVLPAAIVLGVVNAVLYEKSGSIWPAVVAHAVNNAILFVWAAVVVGVS